MRLEFVRDWTGLEIGELADMDPDDLDSLVGDSLRGQAPAGVDEWLKSAEGEPHYRAALDRLRLHVKEAIRRDTAWRNAALTDVSNRREGETIADYTARIHAEYRSITGPRRGFLRHVETARVTLRAIATKRQQEAAERNRKRKAALVDGRKADRAPEGAFLSRRKALTKSLDLLQCGVWIAGDDPRWQAWAEKVTELLQQTRPMNLPDRTSE